MGRRQFFKKKKRPPYQRPSTGKKRNQIITNGVTSSGGKRVPYFLRKGGRIALEPAQKGKKKAGIGSVSQGRRDAREAL